jgi:murein DD-endopeptidase MepM/ murein hydrolase activator NlpD
MFRLIKIFHDRAMRTPLILRAIRMVFPVVICVATFVPAAANSNFGPSYYKDTSPSVLADVSYHEAFPDDFVKFALGKIVPGGLVWLQLKKGVQLAFDGNELPNVDGWTLIGFDRDVPDPIELVYTLGERRQVYKIELGVREYDIQRIDGVAKKYVTPSPKKRMKIKQDQALKSQARSVVSSRTDFLSGVQQGFKWPVRGRISGVYGSQRVFNGEPRRPHYGVDIAAPAGEKVRAGANGVVTLAEGDMYFEGGLVFIDHGLNLTSVYMHMGAVHVSAGQEIKAGDVIGEVGSKGRSTGAHLDWRMFWRDKHIDPAILVEPMPLEDLQPSLAVGAGQ